MRPCSAVTLIERKPCVLEEGHDGLHIASELLWEKMPGVPREQLGCQLVVPVDQTWVSPDSLGIPRPIDVQPTSPTVSVPDLTTPELAALMIAGQEPDAVGCAKCGRSMDWHPAVCFECIEYPGRYEYCSHPLACESYIDPDFNAYQDSDDE